MTNHDKASDWLVMAHTALSRSLRSFSEGDLADAVRHAQESQERAAKAVLQALGKEPRKTHRPMQDLREGLLASPGELERLGLTGEPAVLLLRASASAPLLEGQGTAPRYGWDLPDRIVRPEEIYDDAIAGRILRAFADTMQALVAFLRAAGLPVRQETLDALDARLGEYAARLGADEG
ncbi:MAG: HEPN domain-containing protein [Deltaproteobacteria bacterium]|nr:HEPN domain-containing protein [Deltaproteobacteria bacterium]